MKIPHLQGECHFCRGIITNPYEPSVMRHHCTKGLGSEREKFGEDLRIYPTVHPVPAAAPGGFVPDPRSPEPIDGLLVVNLEDDELRSVEPSCLGIPTLPFPDPDPRLAHLRCGNAVLYSLDSMATRFQFASGSVFVCDMETYYWSNTLKDPRTWAVMNTAVKANIKHVGVWTAGNAGLSLTKMAYCVNKLLRPEERISTYCYSIKGALDPTLQERFRWYGAKTHSFDSPTRGRIFPLEHIVEEINLDKSPVEKITTDDFWDVTDGWDGVGLYMYRLIGRQICLYVRPKFIVLPVGTGDLFFGIFQGRQDCVDEGLIEPTECHIRATIPLSPTNILDNYKDYELGGPSLSSDGKSNTEPITPKLDTIYTPLLLAMYRAILQQDCVKLVGVGWDDQHAAAQRLRNRARRDLICASEPSALIAFAALPQIAAELESGARTGTTAVDKASARVVVINSGFGFMGQPEYDLLACKT